MKIDNLNEENQSQISTGDDGIKNPESIYKGTLPIYKPETLSDTLIQELAEIEKGCGKFLYEDDFEDDKDLFDHDVNCGTRLIRNNGLVLCPTCTAHKKGYLEGRLKGFREELEFIKNHVYYDNEPCNFDHHGYCQDHHTLGEDKCSNQIILKEIDQLNQNIKLIEDNLGEMK